MPPVTYTNRKGLIYYLCQTTTKTGKPRYYFAREQKGEPMDEIPEGFEIGESVNGLVFVRKVRPMQILPKEVAAVEAAVKKHPKSSNYRVNVKHARIEIYESTGPDVEELLSRLTGASTLFRGREQDMRETLEQGARFTPVLRFILADAKRRTFRVERMHYGGRDEWFELGHTGPAKRLAQRLVSTLGTQAFFELY
ncbi:MAG: hypothetical protein GY832_25395 [Chloroflexi bacterium]|nr:hypothetical protein [Chloroflexota bacterium]